MKNKIAGDQQPSFYRDIECVYCARAGNCPHESALSMSEEILGHRIECWLRPTLDTEFTGFHELRVLSFLEDADKTTNQPFWYHQYDSDRDFILSEVEKN